MEKTNEEKRILTVDDVMKQMESRLFLLHGIDLQKAKTKRDEAVVYGKMKELKDLKDFINYFKEVN